MTARQERIFSNLHARHLQPKGFKKFGTRSERAALGLHQAVVWFSSRFNDPRHIRFTVELRVGDEALFQVFRPGASYPGLSETTAPLLSWRLKEPDTGHAAWWTWEPDTDDDVIEESIARLILEQALPQLDRAQTLEGIADLCELLLPGEGGWQAHSWVLFRLGRMTEASAILSKAMNATASHHNKQSGIQKWATSAKSAWAGDPQLVDQPHSRI